MRWPFRRKPDRADAAATAEAADGGAPAADRPLGRTLSTTPAGRPSRGTEPTEDAPAPAARVASRREWTALPPLEPTVRPVELTSPASAFAAEAAGSQDLIYRGPALPRRSADAPRGVVEGLARPMAAPPEPDVPLLGGTVDTGSTHPTRRAAITAPRGGGSDLLRFTGELPDLRPPPPPPPPPVFEPVSWEAPPEVLQRVTVVEQPPAAEAEPDADGRRVILRHTLAESRRLGLGPPFRPSRPQDEPGGQAPAPAEPEPVALQPGPTPTEPEPVAVQPAPTDELPLLFPDVVVEEEPEEPEPPSRRLGLGEPPLPTDPAKIEIVKPVTEPVPTDMRSALQHAYGVDVGARPVRRGPEVSAEARALGVQAFTRRGEVFLPAEEGPLSGVRARATLAHELTHVAQQHRLGSSLPSPRSSEGRRLELGAQVAERYYRGDPDAPLPGPDLLHPAVPHQFSPEALAGSASAYTQRVADELVAQGIAHRGWDNTLVFGPGPDSPAMADIQAKVMDEAEERRLLFDSQDHARAQALQIADDDFARRLASVKEYETTVLRGAPEGSFEWVNDRRWIWSGQDRSVLDSGGMWDLPLRLTRDQYDARSQPSSESGGSTTGSAPTTTGGRPPTGGTPPSGAGGSGGLQAEFDMVLVALGAHSEAAKQALWDQMHTWMGQLRRAGVPDDQLQATALYMFELKTLGASIDDDGNWSPGALSDETILASAVAWAGVADVTARRTALTALQDRARARIRPDQEQQTPQSTTAQRPTPGGSGATGLQAEFDLVLVAHGAHTDDQKQVIWNTMHDWMGQLRALGVPDDEVQAAALHMFELKAMGASVADDGTWTDGPLTDANVLNSAATWAGRADVTAQRTALDTLSQRGMAALAPGAGGAPAGGPAPGGAAATGAHPDAAPTAASVTGRPAVDPQDIPLNQLANRLFPLMYERLRSSLATTLERRNPTAR